MDNELENGEEGNLEQSIDVVSDGDEKFVESDCESVNDLTSMAKGSDDEKNYAEDEFDDNANVVKNNEFNHDYDIEKVKDNAVKGFSMTGSVMSPGNRFSSQATKQG